MRTTAAMAIAGLLVCALLVAAAPGPGKGPGGPPGSAQGPVKSPLGAMPIPDSYPCPAPAEAYFEMRSAEELAAAWEACGTGGPMPEVDFERHMLVGYAWGEKPTLGYAVQVKPLPPGVSPERAMGGHRGDGADDDASADDASPDGGAQSGGADEVEGDADADGSDESGDGADDSGNDGGDDGAGEAAGDDADGSGDPAEAQPADDGPAADGEPGNRTLDVLILRTSPGACVVGQALSYPGQLRLAPRAQAVAFHAEDRVAPDCGGPQPPRPCHRDAPSAPKCHHVCDAGPAEAAAASQHTSDDSQGRSDKRLGGAIDPALATAPAQDDACAAIRAFSGHVTFTLDGATGALQDVRLDGKPYLASLVLVDDGELHAVREAHSLQVGDDDTLLTIHDNPTGLLRFKGHDGSVVLTFPDGVTAVPGAEGARILYADGRSALLRADAPAFNGTQVNLTGFFALHMPPGPELPPPVPTPGGPPQADDVRRHVEDAVERRHVGAQISLRPTPPVAAMGAMQQAPVQVLAYDDLAVEVQMPAGLARPDAPIRVEVSAELDEGRTIVLDIDPSLLEGEAAGELQLRYYDILEQAQGVRREQEVPFLAASSLADILDPTDDAGQPEYYLVSDDAGMHVLVSVPHWSAHAITVAGLAKAVQQPSVVIGILVGAAGVVLAVAGLVWPRRRRDEF